MSPPSNRVPGDGGQQTAGRNTTADFNDSVTSDTYPRREEGHGPSGSTALPEDSESVGQPKTYMSRKSEHGSGPTGEGVQIERSEPFNTRGAKGYNDRVEGNGPDPLSNDPKSKKGDSAVGKMMEKAGDVLKKPDLAAKGTAKREQA